MASPYAVDDSPAVLVYTSPGHTGSILVRTETSDDPVYVGGSGVTSSTGFPIFSTDEPIRLPVSETTVLYAICASAGTATLHVLQ